MRVGCCRVSWPVTNIGPNFSITISILLHSHAKQAGKQHQIVAKNSIIRNHIPEPQNNQTPAPDPNPRIPSEKVFDIYGPMMLVNKIYYSHLLVKSGLVLPPRPHAQLRSLMFVCCRLISMPEPCL